MTHGLDTGFLFAAEIAEHADHIAARNSLTTLIAAGDHLAIAPQVVAEFIHVATDSRRLVQPLSMATAINIATRWWTAKEVVRIFPDALVMDQFLPWMNKFALGRKRLLDTLLAATFQEAGIQSILTTNPADFAVFGVFTFTTPSGTTP
ncbi:MAG: PIN domain-containing protein [Planctomycetes bacterium]|nr:PIN domain-containing protein [Planctomycetota bacterium]